MPARRFPPPWSVEEYNDACFIVRDHTGQALACVYYEEESGRRSAAKLRTKDEARRIVVTLLPKYQSHCCPNIIRNGDKLLLRNQATKIAISLRGSDRGDHAPYIMIVALPVFAMFALVYTTRTHDRTYGFKCTVDCSGHEAGYRWAEQNNIDDEDYCPDGDSESFYEGCIDYVRGMADRADNDVGAGTPINPDADDDDDSDLRARK